MSLELQKFEIQLDRPDHRYSPGEIIAGRVIVYLNEPKIITGIKVTIKGEAKVNWDDAAEKGSDFDGSESDSDESKSDTDESESDTDESESDVNVSKIREADTIQKEVEEIGKESNASDIDETPESIGEEEYFTMDFYVLGKADGENVTIKKGSHVFPFEFYLPHDIPSSFETTHGYIRYTVKAVVDGSWELDHETSKPFNVLTPYNLNECPTPMTAIVDEECETFCCFAFFNLGAIKVNIFLPTNGYTIGETIRATITINNTTKRVDVTGIELQLEQIITFYASSDTKTETEIVQSAKETGPFRKKDQVVVNMEVPSVPYSDMVHCNLMNVEYNLIVKISISHVSTTFQCEAARDKKYPIVIGTKPGFEVQSMKTAAAVPTAPLLDFESPPYSDPISSYGSTSSTANTFVGQRISSAIPTVDLVTQNLAQARTMDYPPPTYNETMGINDSP